MQEIKLRFSERDTTPQQLNAVATDLDLTVEELCHRFLAEGLSRFEPVTPAVPAETLHEFLAKNNVMKQT